MTDKRDKPFDLFIIGGGINGAGIARDAAGRGLNVALCEMNDFASGTSSASTKLIHGGLRYLEQYKFRLVREALAEREVLMRLAPHIVRPLSFVLPLTPGMRPGWLIRAGLWVYDRLGGPSRLPRSRAVLLHHHNIEGQPLRPEIRRGFAYSDCWVDDARLVVLNVRAAADLGATVLPRTECVAAHRDGGIWRIETLDRRTGKTHHQTALVMVNAAGPWVERVTDDVVRMPSPAAVQLIKGSHIIVPRLYQGEHAYILQSRDRRVVFIIPYEGEFTLIGTTDVELSAMPEHLEIGAEEVAYLCDVASGYLKSPVTPKDVVWDYAGVRPLYDDGSTNPSELTRDYVLAVNHAAGQAPMLTVYGGKITTYRRLAEQAMQRIATSFPGLKPAWTATHSLPGGEMPGADFESFLAALCSSHAGLPREFITALARRHGSRCRDILRGSQLMDDLGAHFGAGLTAREVDYLMDIEWAREPDDVLWRRTKCGLHMTEAQRRVVASYISARASAIGGDTNPG